MAAARSKSRGDERVIDGVVPDSSWRARRSEESREDEEEVVVDGSS